MKKLTSTLLIVTILGTWLTSQFVGAQTARVSSRAQLTTQRH